MKISALTIILIVLSGGCSVAETNSSVKANSVVANSSAATNTNSTEPKGATITIDPNGPADTVRAFYKLLREKKFREAIFLTNLRPAIEGLTESELSEFAIDFEELAGQIPAEIEINGEIITGDNATVTANLPTEDGDKNEIQTIKLKKTGDVWMIQTADEEASKRIKQEGKEYLYNLKVETHEQEAKKMLDRISKAQLAHSLQNGGAFADMDTLIAAGLLPDDIKTSDSTGYRYSIDLAANKRTYTASALPAVYGKSGKTSYLLRLDAKGISRVSSKDNGGKPIK